MFGDALAPAHILVVLLVVLIFFGRGKVSSLMGEVGKGISAFKKGISEASVAEAKELDNPKGSNES